MTLRRAARHLLTMVAGLAALTGCPSGESVRGVEHPGSENRPGMRKNEGAGEVVIPDVPLTVDHPYRTITFDATGRLYLSVGAEDNLTPGDGAVIMRYAVPATIPPRGIAYATGERFAAGIRNAEALAWDHDGRLWAFVNGRDFLRPPGTEETFYLDHPGDWFYRLSDRAGTFYGFPNCWVLGTVPWGDRRDAASQWSDPDANQGHDDAWCQNTANVHPAAGSLPAHTAPSSTRARCSRRSTKIRSS